MTAPRMSIPQDLMTEVFKELVRLNANQELLTKLRDEMEAYASTLKYTSMTTTVHSPEINSCNLTLQGMGQAYPRTCKVCGLGPCKYPRVEI